ncbi:hypothetical protein [Ferruginibacter sp.]
MKKIALFTIVLLCAAAANAQQPNVKVGRGAIKAGMVADSMRQLIMSKDSAAKKPVKKMPQKAAGNLEAKRKD